MKVDHLEDLIALPWCTALLSDPSVTHISKRLVPDANSERANGDTLVSRALFTDSSIRAYVTLYRPGNGQGREVGTGNLMIKSGFVRMEPSPESRQQETRRQAKKQEKHFDISDSNSPEGIALVSVGSDVNGGPGRFHGGIICTLLDHCMGGFLHYAYETRALLNAELTVKFKRPMYTPTVFMVRTKVKREVGRWIETVGWVEDGHGTVFAEASATYVLVKIEEAKL
ncbi:hypothetical protein COCCADRAFT_28472 [Bipolaris zeicola 26-R-13]|uniref:Thioesterase domain-containing protein n=1 Tax=Cochliobolus carbonum (strain 26-R-13) TaxID=930089 RepID=W6XZJ1_COCC2|nr:uncharacterized protein COCCADRAFT_28472 [Bipolaris zeicola 26-R-13]EUC30695.1 hypothetical protein COCCADRAFT_28472 [Bipolaris zeicola 26-R-13]